ncbi:MAG TPA: hypothetical protein VFQ54_01470 [Thermomicrobiales bacterium]|nr:hypothetical protein [Thermomicrobiales bacterium]
MTPYVPNWGKTPAAGPGLTTPLSDQSSPEATGGTETTPSDNQKSPSGTDGDLSSASPDSSVAPIEPGGRLYVDDSQDVLGSTVDPSDASTSTSGLTSDQLQWPKGETGTVVGWRDGVVFYDRQDDQGQISYFIADVDGSGNLSGEQNLGSDPGKAWLPTGAPAYRYQDGIVVQTAGGWVVATSHGARFTKSINPGETLTTVRVDGVVSPSGFIAFQTSGGIEIDYLDSGESTVVDVGNVVDFDLSGDGSQLVISTGSDIEIWSVDGGQHVSRYANSQGISVGSVLWYGDTIYFVDTQTNAVMTIGLPTGGQ